MDKVTKKVSLLLMVLLAVFNLIILQNALAQSDSNLSVPEFSLKFVDNSYNVAPTVTFSTDPYTNKTTTTMVPGYNVENKTVEAEIKNNVGASYYNFRYKGHYTEQWSYEPFNSEAGSNAYTLADSYSVPFKASNSANTTISLYFIPKSIAPNGQIDIQIQALYGNFDAIPYGHIMPLPGGPTYDFYFRGETSDWSNTQTIVLGQNSVSNDSPNPTIAPTTASTPVSADPTSSSIQTTAIMPYSNANSASVPLTVFVVTTAALVLKSAEKP
jgi:hypothetical protein